MGGNHAPSTPKWQILPECPVASAIEGGFRNRIRDDPHKVLIDLYSDIKRRIETRTCLRLFSLYLWEKQTTEKMFGPYPSGATFLAPGPLFASILPNQRRQSGKGWGGPDGQPRITRPIL
jgi:hypothetical protein